MTIMEYIERRGLAIGYLAIVWIVTMLLAAFVLPKRFAMVEAWQVALTWKVANPFSAESPRSMSKLRRQIWGTDGESGHPQVSCPERRIMRHRPALPHATIEPDVRGARCPEFSSGPARRLNARHVSAIDGSEWKQNGNMDPKSGDNSHSQSSATS
jgi:hypothetical protein